MEIDIEILRRFYGWNEKTEIKDCAERAYGDLRRAPLAGIAKLNNEETKNNWYEAMLKHISNRISMLTDSQKVYDFDTWHAETCDNNEKKEGLLYITNKEYNIKLKDKKKDKKFTYGHAQKWLNMTIKNMIVAGIWDETLSRYDDKLHVPIDRAVIRAVQSSVVEKGGLGLKKICKDERILELKGEHLRISNDITISWSQLDDYGYYMMFQNEIRNKLNDLSTYKCPMDWELKVWSNFRN